MEEMNDNDRQWWADRLQDLYEEAKTRNGGNSLGIYNDVVQMLDYLEGVDDLPEDLDLPQECNNLAHRLRSA